MDVNPIPRSEYARHATDLFTILQNTLISNRVIQTLTKTNRITARFMARVPRNGGRRILR